MYILKSPGTQKNYLDALTAELPIWFNPMPDDYNRKVMITIERADFYVMVELLAFPPRLPVEVKLGGSVTVNGHEIESGEKKMLVQTIVADLLNSLDKILPRDKEVLSFHPTQQ